MDQRLVDDPQLVALDGAAEIVFQLQAGHDLSAHVRVEDLRAAPPLRLGPVHGRIGIADELAGILIFRSSQGHTDTDGDEDLALADQERCGHGALNSLGRARRSGRVSYGLDENRKLVAAEPGHSIGRAQRLRQALADCNQ